ncbi:unnamed protein product [Calicophoron daubneyi]|uniref:Peptidase A1 domain-containing protein n=1 Tax=Calicophoron daubneyi TaxID=300641 RepID=A0AAV2TRY7_CALDB
MCKNHTRYDASKSVSKKETTEEFSYVEYGTTINGTITEDIVTLDGQTLRQPFGEAKATNGETLAHTTFDGSFGLGVCSTGSKQPTILESLVNSGVIKKKVFGIYARSNASGEIMFGGYDKRLFIGQLEFVPVSSQQEWMFDIKSITFGDELLTGTKCQGVVNGGSHHIYGPKEQVEKIYKKLNCDPYKLCKVDCSKISTFPQLKITVKTTDFMIGPENYIDKEDDKCTGRIFHLNQPAWVLGNLFLDKVYTAYDVENAKIGFALAVPPASTISISPTTATPRTTTTTTTTSTTTPTTTTTTTQPTATSATSTLCSHKMSVEISAVRAVLRFLQM